MLWNRLVLFLSLYNTTDCSSLKGRFSVQPTANWPWFILTLSQSDGRQQWPFLRSYSFNFWSFMSFFFFPIRLQQSSPTLLLIWKNPTLQRPFLIQVVRITALWILRFQLNYLREEENKRKNAKVRRAATTRGTKQHRMTPTKTRWEKKGASMRSHTMRLLSVRSRALEAALLRERQQLLSKRQEVPSETGTHRLVRCTVPLTEAVLIPWTGSFHFSRLPALWWQALYGRQIQ